MNFPCADMHPHGDRYGTQLGVDETRERHHFLFSIVNSTNHVIPHIFHFFGMAVRQRDVGCLGMKETQNYCFAPGLLITSEE